MSTSDFEQLIRALLALKNAKECKAFIIDLCTPAEIAAMSERLKVARYLQKGIPYRKISELTNISTATITRVARTLKNSNSGYSIVLKRIKEKENV